MTRDEAIALLERCTYKPRWRFEVMPMYDLPAHGGVVLVFRLHWMAPDATGRQKEDIQLGSRLFNIHEFMTEEYAKRRIYEAIMNCEHHEAAEFFKIDGVPFIEPHPELISPYRNDPYQR